MSNIYASSYAHVYRSSDEGQTWSPLGGAIGRYVAVGGLVLYDDEQTILVACQAVGYNLYIRKSINGGASYNDVFPYTAGQNIYYMEKSRVSDNIFVAGEKTYPYFWYSTDKGASWTDIEVEAVAGDGKACSFIDDDIGWYCTKTKIFKTIDGGDNWTPQKTTGLVNLVGIFALDTDNIWAVSATSTIGVWRSTDGGSNWTEYPHGGIKTKHSVFAYDPDHVWIVGGGETIEACYSTDGGQNWTCVTKTDTGGQDGHIHFINNSIGYMTGKSTFKTTNGGQSWVDQGGIPSASDYQRGNFWDVDFSVQLRSFDITDTEPTDRTTDGLVVSASSPIDFGSMLSGDSPVKCVIFRVVNMGIYSAITNMRFYLYSKDFTGTNSYYLDITDTWTQNKNVAQVSEGTPGTCPEVEPSANVTKISGGNITDIGHADTTQYIYFALNIGGDEPSGIKNFTYRIVYDYS